MSRTSIAIALICLLTIIAPALAGSRTSEPERSVRFPTNSLGPCELPIDGIEQTIRQALSHPAGRACHLGLPLDFASNVAHDPQPSQKSVAPASDAYWQYYADCDQWDVVFGNIRNDLQQLCARERSSNTLPSFIFRTARNFVEAITKKAQTASQFASKQSHVDSVAAWIRTATLYQRTQQCWASTHAKYQQWYELRQFIQVETATYQFSHTNHSDNSYRNFQLNNARYRDVGSRATRLPHRSAFRMSLASARKIVPSSAQPRHLKLELADQLEWLSRSLQAAADSLRLK